MNSRARVLPDRGLEWKIESLARTNARLVQAQARRDRLSTLVVHDLKSPLSGIMLNLRWLRGVEACAEVREALGSIEAASRSMERIVMNLLDIGRSEDGALVPRRSNVDIGSIVEGLLASHHRRASEARIELRASVTPGLTLSADRDLLARVIENLLDNAVRHTPRGGHICVEAEPLDGADSVEIRVRDDGRGIPEDQRERVFQRYAQIEPANCAETECARCSVGLGLFFCRLAIDAHGGTIRAEANDPRGTVFRITLPA